MSKKESIADKLRRKGFPHDVDQLSNLAWISPTVCMKEKTEMSDILERLEDTGYCPLFSGVLEFRKEAADEIKRLRSILTEATALSGSSR